MEKNILSICKFLARKTIYQSKYAIKRWLSRNYVSRQIVRVDFKPIPVNLKEIRLFMTARNESLRLPFILDYYLSQGVNRIFVVDNNSSDDTESIVLSKKETHLFFTNDKYIRQGYWIDFLLRRYGVGHWCLIVDADEVFVYPNYEKVTIHQLCQYLDREAYNVVDAVLLDMYPSVPLDAVEYKLGTDPISIAPWFDIDSYTTDMRGPLFLDDHNIIYEGPERVFGGMRKRVFGVHACISKFPLVKFNRSMFLSAGTHFIHNARVADIRAGLLHFKYLNDFSENVKIEVKREAHWRNAAEYKEYSKTFNCCPSLNLHSSSSRKFTGSDQLITLDIMKTSQKFDEFGCQLIDL